MTIKQKNFRLEEDLIQRLKLRAVERKMNDSELVTEYIERGLQQDTL